MSDKPGSYLELMRFGNCSMASFASLIGMFITYNILFSTGTSLPFPLPGAFGVFLTVLFVTGAGNGMNDYFDVDIDRVNKPSRPIPSGRIKPMEALVFSISILVLGIAIAFFVNFICGLIALFNSLILIYYAKKLKKTPFFGNVSVGYLTGSTFLFGAAAFGVEGISALLVLFILATLATIAREIVKDVEDMEGDEKDGARTLPILIGAKKASYIAVSFGFVAMLASPVPYLQGLLDIRYLLLVSVANIFFIIAIIAILVHNDAAGSSKMFKYAMFFALISFVAGA